VKNNLPIEKCQRHLAFLWLTGSGVVFVVVLIQSLAGLFGSQVGDVWNWLLPNVVPTVSIIIGTLAAGAFQVRSAATVDRFVFRVAVALSFFYLVLLLGTILSSGGLTAISTTALLGRSKYWIAPVQGLLGIALGVFFVSRKSPSE
jgi:hypothetical protein